jgi:hypothetical protein
VQIGFKSKGFKVEKLMDVMDSLRTQGGKAATAEMSWSLDNFRTSFPYPVFNLRQ